MRNGPLCCAVALLAAVQSSCPRADDAREPARAHVAPPAPPPVAKPQPPPPAPPSKAVVAVSASAAAPSLPPELVDDGSDDIVELPEPDPPPPPRGREPPKLASIARETWVYAEPRWGARRIGMLRAGAVVDRRGKPSGNASCDGGWFRVEPRGYVCAGKLATTDQFHPVVEASRVRPRKDDLPYTYVMPRTPGVPLYARAPGAEELARIEPDLAYAQRQLAKKRKEPEFVEPPPPGPMPNALLYGRPAPSLADVGREPDALVVERSKPRSGYALLETFEHEERPFGLTTDLSVVPLDRTRIIRPSSFSGLALHEGTTLPVAFVRLKKAVRYVEDAEGRLQRGDALGFREAVPLDPEAIRREGGAAYWRARNGFWIRAEQVTRVDPPREMPSWASSGRKWIDVSILKQSLVAFDGERPVYVTLVSTGADGLGNPKETHSTIQGTFLIHTKHVTATMDGDDVGDEFDLRDVPFVQYFTDGYALHGAYWHDDFGIPRSHGCVNLAPRDAAWLFGWTTPEVPEGWHAALSLKKGTLVFTHP